MSGARRKYSKEFKLEAIRISESGERSISEIERELGISNGLLWKWKDSWNKQNKKQETFPGNGNLTETEAHIRQLEREILLLKQDKDILKKVLKMYSKDDR